MNDGLVRVTYPPQSVLSGFEGWGQFNTEEMYDYLKKLDATRLIDSKT